MLLFAVSAYALKIDDHTIAQREELLFREIPVVIAAARHEQKITEAPSWVTVITEEDIKNFGWRTLAEALRSVVGFYTINDREYIRVGVRGFLRPGDWGDRILLMVNGHYYNEDIYGGAYTNNVFGLDMDLVKKIEIVRGPGSALYGSNALFAVINVITKTAKEMEGTNLSAGYGLNNTTAGSLIWGNKTKNVDLLLAGKTFNSDGYRVLYFPEFDTRQTNRGIAQNLDWEKANNFFASLSSKNLFLMAGGSSREKAFPTAAYDTIFNDPRASDIDKRGFIELKLQPQISADKKGLLRFYYDQYAYTGNYPYDPIVLNRDYSEGNWWGSEAQLSWDLTPTNKLVVGGEYQNHAKVLLQNYDVDPYNLILNENRPFSLFSLYLQDEIKSEKIGLNLGLRSDNYPDYPNVFNPRLGIVFNPKEGHYLKLLYGKAFRIPNIFEKYYNDQSTSIGNPNLKPETINSYELIYELSSPNLSYLAFSLYQNQISDLISQVSVEASPGVWRLQYQNLDKVKATGAEIYLRKDWGKTYGYLGYTYNQTINENTGQRLENSPENSATAGLVLSFPDYKSTLATELIYLGQRLTRDGNYTSPYLLTNLTLKTKAFLHTEVSLKINNLFDIQYADPASGEHKMDTISQDGRTYFVELSWRI